MSFVEQLRDELVAAAAREQARPRPRLQLPPLRPLALATVGTVILAVLVLAVAGGLSTDRADDPVPAEQPGPEGRPLFGGTLVPGERYRTRSFLPPLSFVVGDDRWYTPDTTSPNVFLLIRVTRGGPNTGPFPPSTLAFDRIREVYDPGVRDVEASLSATPADLLGWLAEHPDLRVGVPTPTSVAGVSGMKAPVVADFTRPTHADPWCRERRFRCTMLWPQASFPDGAALRIIVLDTQPEPLVITTSASDGRRLTALHKAAVPVLESLRIGIR